MSVKLNANKILKIQPLFKKPNKKKLKKRGINLNIN
jgi:hypothetical protein